MDNLKYSKTIMIISCLILIVLIFGGCIKSKTLPVLDLEEVKSKTENYLTQNEYEIDNFNFETDEFHIQGEKNNKIIKIDYFNIRDDYQRCTIIVDNSIEDYNEKYKSIDYNELFELSQILGIEKISNNMIKKACEDERDFYDSTNKEYSLPSDKIMSKIYRVGFFENPIIIYELSYNSETITLLWNS